MRGFTLIELLILVSMVAISFVLLFGERASAPDDFILTDDVDRARRFQRECLDQGYVASVQEQATGILVICRGRPTDNIGD